MWELWLITEFVRRVCWLVSGVCMVIGLLISALLGTVCLVLAGMVGAGGWILSSRVLRSVAGKVAAIARWLFRPIWLNLTCASRGW